MDARWPVTQPYGYDPAYPVNQGWHYGLDYGCPVGSPVYAAAAGVVVVSQQSAPVGFTGILGGAWGRYIEVEHPPFGMRTGYAHLRLRLLEVGDSIARGHVLGLSGDTGLVYGAHLHFQLLNDGQRVDPTPYMEEA